MTIMVGLNIVIAAFLGFSAILCAGASLGMRGNASMAWLAAAIGCGSAQVLTMTFVSSRPLEVLAAAVLGPLGYLCANRAIRLVSRQERRGPVLVSVVLALSGLAIILIAFDSPFFYQALCIQAACAIAITDAVIQMARHTHPRLLDRLLLAGLGIFMLVCVARIPAILLLFGPDASFTEVRRSGFEIVVMVATGLLVIPVVFLLLARSISDIIANYQHQSERDGSPDC